MQTLWHETILALSGLFGDIYYVDGNAVVFDASCARFLSQAEQSAVRLHIVPLATHHWRLRRWVRCYPRLDGLAQLEFTFSLFQRSIWSLNGVCI